MTSIISDFQYIRVGFSQQCSLLIMQKGMTDKDRRRSASNESQALRDLVNKLKLELLQSQVEAQKVRDQLQCVIYLVRR